MAFKKHTPKKIEIDHSQIAHDSPQVAKRLERIETNFEQFDVLMCELEAKLPEEEKTAKSKASTKSKASANPRKPR